MAQFKPVWEHPERWNLHSGTRLLWPGGSEAPSSPQPPVSQYLRDVNVCIRPWIGIFHYYALLKLKHQHAYTNTQTNAWQLDKRGSGLINLHKNCCLKEEHIWANTITQIHLLCSRCWTIGQGSCFGCSGTGTHTEARFQQHLPSTGTPRDPLQRCCPCRRPVHIRTTRLKPRGVVGALVLQHRLIYYARIIYIFSSLSDLCSRSLNQLHV